jgi:hypothetical protein
VKLTKTRATHVILFRKGAGEITGGVWVTQPDTIQALVHKYGTLHGAAQVVVIPITNARWFEPSQSWSELV